MEALLTTLTDVKVPAVNVVTDDKEYVTVLTRVLESILVSIVIVPVNAVTYNRFTTFEILIVYDVVLLQLEVQKLLI